MSTEPWRKWYQVQARDVRGEWMAFKAASPTFAEAKETYLEMITEYIDDSEYEGAIRIVLVQDNYVREVLEFREYPAKK